MKSLIHVVRKYLVRAGALTAVAILSDSPDYRRFFLSSLAVQIGFWIQNAAQIWLVLELTRSGTMVGVLSICQFGPIVVFGLFGGVVADRYDRRATLLATEIALMLSTGALAMLTLSGHAGVWVVMVVAVIRSLLYCVNSPVSQTFAIDLLADKNVASALALNAMGASLARILGPAIAGVMIANLGSGLCFAVSALSYAGMIITVFRMKSMGTRARAASDGLSPLASLAEGLVAVRRDSRLSILVVCLFCICFMPLSFAVVLPVFVLETLGRTSTIYGVLFACIGVGAFLGSVVLASAPRSSPSYLFGAAAGIGVTQMLLVVVRDVAATGVLLVFVGICMAVFLVGINSALLSRTEEKLRGRISAIYVYIVSGIGPLGTSISGWLCEVGGTNLAFGVGSGISLLVAGIGLYSCRRGDKS
jgi:MFS family permease